MSQNYLWRGFLIVVLSVALATPARAQSGGKIGPSNGTIVGAIVGVAAAVAVVIVVAIHYSKKRTITGCVNSTGSGMTVTDEKDKQIYTLSGNTTSIKPGDRMKLQGKKVKSKGADKTLVWEAKAVTKDFGVCQP
jgi:hypothetical protein